MNSDISGSDRLDSASPRAAVLARHIVTIKWIVRIAPALPGILYFANVAPPDFNSSLLFVTIILAVSIIAFVWGSARERQFPCQLSRILKILAAALITFSAYIILLNDLSVYPPENREGSRRQIGFGMYALTETAELKIDELSQSTPTIELHTPNDLMNAFGVWGGQGRVEEIWPKWSINLARLTLITLFSASCVFWSYGLGAAASYFSSTSLGQDITSALSRTTGHFVLDSGYHSDTWFHLDQLFVDARSTRDWAAQLAHLARKCRAEIVCAPMEYGALIGQLVAADLEISFVYLHRIGENQSTVDFKVPNSLRHNLRGRRVLFVNDLSDLGTTLQSCKLEIFECGGELVGIAHLIAIGQPTTKVASVDQTPTIWLATVNRRIWRSDECQLCRDGIPPMRAFTGNGTLLHFEAIQAATVAVSPPST